MPIRVQEDTIYGGPQGEDAFVKIRLWTLDETTTYNRMGEVIKDAEKINIAAKQKLAETVLEWNWVDNDGTPLPQPHNNPEVFGALLAMEIRWLVTALQGNSKEQMNPKKTDSK